MLQSIVGALGRALISLIFILSAIQKLADWDDSKQLLHQTLTDWMPVTLHSPMMQGWLDWSLANITTLLCLAILFELLGGLLVFLGIKVRLGAFLLCCVLCCATLLFHHFWDFVQPQRQIEMVNFMKNLSILGGLLFILARGKRDLPSKSSSKED
jgi:putative oxidoreductase